MIARWLASRAGKPAGMRVGGFNLLPYRQRDARRQRRWRLFECLSAGLCGAAAALIGTATGTSDEARVERTRAELESALAAFGAPLAEHRRLASMQAQAREHAELASRLAAPGSALLGVVEALGREPMDGIALVRLRHTRGSVELMANASDGAAPAAWVERLARVRGVRAAEVAGLRFASGGAGQDVEFVARLSVDDAPRQEAVPTQRGRARRQP